MRARVDSIALRGTSRRYEFAPGLNIVQGEIATGKSSLLQLIHGLFGSSLENLIPEIQEHVSHIEGSLVLGNEAYRVIRPVTSTATAKVEIAGENVALRLPALSLDATAEQTYGQWLLQKLQLPVIEIALSETRADAPVSPVSINDYFLYCYLRWSEIDTSVFGHHDPFKNRKRMVVFRIIYGLYNADIARLEEEVRRTTVRLREAQTKLVVLEQTFAGTPFENRAEVMTKRDAARRALLNLEVAAAEQARGAQSAAVSSPQTQALRSAVIDLDREVARLRQAEADEARAAEQLEQLGEQLRAQSRRLTKSIVADRLLLDYDFYRCPRCNSSLNATRADTDQCYVCLQTPAPAVTREDLEREQQRLERQLLETKELVETHNNAAKALGEALQDALERRKQTAGELDFYTRTYVSDSAGKVAAVAAERAQLQAELKRYGDYLEVLDKFQGTAVEVGRLEKTLDQLRDELQSAQNRLNDVGQRFVFLDDRLERLLDVFSAPRSAERSAARVNRQTYLPIVDGRPFDNLHSPGLTVQVNVAYAIANHLAALNFDLPLPNILLIDGFTSNIGTEGADPERRRRMYNYLIELSRRYGERLQVIVADNDVPEFAQDFVKVTLSEADRLIPIPGPRGGPDSA